MVNILGIFLFYYLFFTIQGFAMDPLLSDMDESIHSQSETESDEDVESDSDVAQDTIQESQTGIYTSLSVFFRA